MLHWFKRNPHWLQTETKLLATDSNYDQNCIFRGEYLVSQGTIIVRLEDTYEYPILIVYPNSTPYHLPLIFPLKALLPEKEVEELANDPGDQILEKIRPHIKLFHRYRHQNGTGALCILEPDDLDNGAQFYGITTVLKRVREWYTGHHTGIFPPEGEEVEFAAHFSYVNDEYHLLYPEYFLNAELTEGDCYAYLFKRLKFKSAEKYHYIYGGLMLCGLNKAGLLTPTEANWGAFKVDDQLQDYNDFVTKKDLVDKLIADKTLVKMLWFNVEYEIEPFETFADLISIIGGGNYDKGVERIAQHIPIYFNYFHSSFLIALRFPNRKGQLEFQPFKVYQKEQPEIEIVGQSGIEKAKTIMARYERVEVITTEKLTNESFHQRNSKRATYDLLKKNVVNILGVGALGSEIADSLAKAGINLFLNDKQVLNAHNAVRHLAGIEYAFESKVDAVSEIVRNHNPFIQVVTDKLDLLTMQYDWQALQHDLNVCSVADDNVEGYINEQLVIARKPAFYVRALRGGKVARIIRVIPGVDACFHCLSHYRQDKNCFIEIPEDENYPTLKNECNNPIRPGSAADMKMIASIASRLIIEHLQDPKTEFNQYIWSTESIDGTPINEPYKLYPQLLKPHPKCYYCNNENKSEVFILKNQLDQMSELVRQDAGTETGGVLAGHLDEAGNIVITHASGPGPNAKHSRTRFEKDITFCQNFLDTLIKESSGKTIYVGEWHSHPGRDTTPSPTDLGSLTAIALQKEYLTEKPVMLIFSSDGVPTCTVHPTSKVFYDQKITIINHV